PHQDAVDLFALEHHPRRYQTTHNVRSLLEHAELLAPESLPRSYAHALLEIPKEESLEAWLDSLPGRSTDASPARNLAPGLRNSLAPAPPAPPADTMPPSLTYAATSPRRFEVAYWKTIANLAHGRFRNKDNADCVLDEATQAALAHHRRDLETLGTYL